MRHLSTGIGMTSSLWACLLLAASGCNEDLAVRAEDTSDLATLDLGDDGVAPPMVNIDNGMAMDGAMTPIAPGAGMGAPDSGQSSSSGQSGSNSGNSGDNSGNSGNSGSGDNSGNSGNSGSGDNSGNSGNSDNSGNSGNSGNSDNSGNSGNNSNSGDDSNSGNNGNASDNSGNMPDEPTCDQRLSCPTRGELSCVGNAVSECILNLNNGCLEWDSTMMCRAGESCVRGACVADGDPGDVGNGDDEPDDDDDDEPDEAPGDGGDEPEDVQCREDCVLGEQRCATDMFSQICGADALNDGCNRWGNRLTCGPGFRCDRATGALICQPAVNSNVESCDEEGDLRCHEDRLQDCRATLEIIPQPGLNPPMCGPCLEWRDQDRCDLHGLVCIEEAGEPTCGESPNTGGACSDEECEPGAVRCVQNDSLERHYPCVADVSGCGLWDRVPQYCPEPGVCRDDACRNR